MTPTARTVAADILARSHSRHGFVGDLTDEALGSPASLSPQDRRFVTHLVFGVMRRRGTLDAVLRAFVQRPFHEVEPVLADVLRLGAFQLLFLTHVPKHAAVHETVNLADHVDRPRAKGFVNGVLRRVAECVTDEFVDYGWTDTVPFSWSPSPPGGEGSGVRGGPAADAKGVSRASAPHPGPLPQGERGWYRKLTKDLLPDPEQNLPEYLAAAFSWPRWLADRWLARHDRDECVRLGFWFNSPPPLWLRVNKLRHDRESYRLLLAAALIDAVPGAHPQSLRLTEHANVRDLPGYAEGDFAVQDHSSLLVASALNPQPGMRILDLCSAPGGKTTHLAELADNRAKITACDIDQKRLDTVASLCQRLGINGVETVLLGEHDDPPAGPFDAALVDVPCSNTGVMGRRPEVRWRLRPGEFEHLIRLQTKLLFQAIDRVKPGGVVVYSTCSIEPDENRGVVDAVRRGVRGLTVEADAIAVPGMPSDGGYWARLRKPV